MNVRMYPKFLTAFFFILLVTPSFAQKKKKAIIAPLDTITIVHDKFEGYRRHGHDTTVKDAVPADEPDDDAPVIIPKDTIPVVLEMVHLPGQDEGTFILTESVKGPDGKIKKFATQGNYFTQVTQVNDEDAHVIAFSGDGEEFQVFYERKNDSTLQELTATFKEMKPLAVFTLTRMKMKAPVKDTLTPFDKSMMRVTGTYRGKLPCADCSSITTSLSLHFRLHGKTGDYILTDKYIGTRNGDISNERKGRWTIISKLIQADHTTLFIVLDPDKRSREAYYLVKRDGIIQVDNNFHSIPSSGDQTLRR